MTTPRYVVLMDELLGYVHDAQPSSVFILRSFAIQHNGDPAPGSVALPLNPKHVRDASPADFAHFRVRLPPLT